MKFSLVMPAYNSEKTIAESIETVIDQTYENWELIIVNDGSRDSTLEIIKDYAKRDARIRFFSQDNAGTAAANNFGISQAKGDYVSIFPSDDWLLPNYLEEFERQIKQKPGYDIYTANGWFKFESGREALIIPKNELSFEPTFIEIIKICPCSLGAMVKQGVHEKVGWYRKERYTEDYDFWLRAAQMGFRYFFFDMPLVKVRISQTQKSANVDAIHDSDLLIMHDLLNAPNNSAEVRNALLRRIKEKEAMKREPLIGALNLELEESAAAFSNKVEKIVGSKNHDLAMKVIHSVSFMVRPLRKFIFKMKVVSRHQR